MTQDWREDAWDRALPLAFKDHAPSHDSHGRDPATVQELEQYFRQFHAEVEPSPYREPTAAIEGGTEQSYGRVVHLHQDVGADIVRSQVTQGVQTPLLRSSQQWTVTVQPKADIPPQASFPGFINLLVQYMIGGATFSKNLRMTGNIARSFPVFGRRVIVNLQLVSDPATAPHDLDVAIGIELGTLPGPERYNATWWNTYGQALANAYALWTKGLNTASPDGVPGVLSAYSLACSDLGGAAALYPMFFDLPDLATLGAGFGPLHTGQVLTTAPTTASFDDEFDPSLFFQDGLIFAFSSTPRLYTAVAGARATLEYKIGQ
jgi:hypothetical protein